MRLGWSSLPLVSNSHGEPCARCSVHKTAADAPPTLSGSMRMAPSGAVAQVKTQVKDQEKTQARAGCAPADTGCVKPGCTTSSASWQRRASAITVIWPTRYRRFVRGHIGDAVAAKREHQNPTQPVIRTSPWLKPGGGSKTMRSALAGLRRARWRSSNGCDVAVSNC